MPLSDSPDDRAPHARTVRLQPESIGWSASRSPAERSPTWTTTPDALADRPIPRAIASDGPPSPPPEDRPAPARRTETDREVATPVWPAGTPRADRAVDCEVERLVSDDTMGGEWRVFERDARSVPGSRGPRCLYFDGEGIVRRVWRYPADWPSLPAPALLALMDRPPLLG